MRIFAFALVFILAVCAALPVSATTVAYDTEFALSFTSASAQKSSTIGLKLDVTNNTSYTISDMTLSLQFDATVLSFNASATKLPDSSYTVSSNSGVLTLKFDAADSTKNIGKNTSIQLMFDVLSTTSASSTSVRLLSTPAPIIQYVNGSDTKNLTFDASKLPTANITIDSAVTTTAASEAKLTNIEIGINNSLNSDITLKPSFSPDIYEYTAEIPYNTSPMVQATPASGAICTPESRLGGADDDYHAVFYFNVKNADGTKTNRYTVKIYAAAAGAFSTTTTTVTTTTLTQDTVPTAAVPTPEYDRNSDDKTVELSMWAIIGLIGGEIALFLLAFFAGFKSRENSEKAEELVRAQIEAQNPQNKNNQQVMFMPVPMNMMGALPPSAEGDQMNAMMPPQGGFQPMDPEQQAMSKYEQVLQNQLRRRQIEMGIPNMEDAAIEQIPMNDPNMMQQMGEMPVDNMGMPMGAMPMDNMGMPMGTMPMDNMGMPMGGMPMDNMGMPMGAMPMDNMGMPINEMPMDNMNAQMQYDPYGNMISYDENGQQIQYDQFGNQL